MARGVQILPEIRLIILRMKADNVPNSSIINWTGVSERSVQRIVQEYETTGSWGVKERKPHVVKLDAAVTEVSFV